MIRVTYELEPSGEVDRFVAVSSTGIADGPAFVQPALAGRENGRVALDFPLENWGADVTLLVSALLAGEWADLSAFERCRLVAVEWTDGLWAGPAFGAGDDVLVGAIVKPSLGLAPRDFAATAAALARGGADFVKDDELLGDPAWCPLEERIRAVVDVLPREVAYAPNVTGAVDSLLQRATRAVELGATALMVNAFAQGLDAVRLLRDAELGVPIFAHRVGSALWTRGRDVGVAGHVLCELVRLCGADFVQVGSFNGKVVDTRDDVAAQLEACRRPLSRGVRPSVAVLGGGVGPANAADELASAGVAGGVMLLLGSAAYSHPGGPEEGVRATVAAVR